MIFLPLLACFMAKAVTGKQGDLLEENLRQIFL